MISPHMVEQLEELAAAGRQVKAIEDAYQLALAYLPAHQQRLEEFSARSKPPLALPADAHFIETFMYRQVEPDNHLAATVVVWCAKWFLGRSDVGHERIGKETRTVVLRDRADFATNVFIALRALAASVPPAAPTTKWTDERKQQLAQYRAEHGTNAAAEHFGISPARVRKLLPREEEPIRPHNPFPFKRR